MAWKQAHRNIFYVIKKAEEEECSSTENTQEKSLRLKCLVMWFPGGGKHSSGYQHVKTSVMISLYVKLLHTVQVWRLLWVHSHWWNIPLSPQVEVWLKFRVFFPFSLSSLSSVMYTMKTLLYFPLSNRLATCPVCILTLVLCCNECWGHYPKTNHYTYYTERFS